jgi:hypothetical protein
MTETKTKVIVDCSTGETTVVPLTAEEIAVMQAAHAQAEADQLAAEEVAAAREAARASGIAKLLALGLTQEEAEALINK